MESMAKNSQPGVFLKLLKPKREVSVWEKELGGDWSGEEQNKKTGIFLVIRKTVWVVAVVPMHWKDKDQQGGERPLCQRSASQRGNHWKKHSSTLLL